MNFPLSRNMIGKRLLPSGSEEGQQEDKVDSGIEDVLPFDGEDIKWFAEMKA